MHDDQQQSVQAAIAGEMRLLDPEVRASSALISHLLDPEFVEFGASGRRWDRTSILAAMAPGPGESPEPITVTELSGVLIAPGLVHLTYLSDNGGRRARRSSLWRRTAAGWQVYFHQGTLTNDV